MKLLVPLWFALASVAESGWAEPRTEQPSPAEASLPQDGIVAEVNGRVISEQAFTTRAASVLFTIAKVVYREKQFRLEAMIDDMLLQQEAEGRKISKETLVSEVADTAHMAVSDVEAAEYYVNNVDNFPEGQEAAKAKILHLVREEKARDKLQEFARALRKNARVSIFLAPPSAEHTTASPSSAHPATIAEVNGKVITARALEDSIAPRLAQLEPSFHQLKRKVVEEMIGEALSEEEAKKRGVSTEELFESVTQVKAVAIPDETVDKISQRMTAKEKPADSRRLKNEIRQRLQRRQVEPKWQAFLRELKTKATIKINLSTPVLRPESSQGLDQASVSGLEERPHSFSYSFLRFGSREKYHHEPRTKSKEAMATININSMS
jgi:hypothetical protein